MEEMTPMPMYQSHKRVRALKIQHVSLLPGDNPNDVVAHVFFEDQTFAPIKVNLYGKPTPHSGWYYVRYEPDAANPDGYESFSPPEAFVKGYRPIIEWEIPG